MRKFVSVPLDLVEDKALSGAAVKLLVVFFAHDFESTTTAALAERLPMDLTTVWRALSILVREGWITKAATLKDGRAVASYRLVDESVTGG